jgi:hypothetical protein
VHRRYIDSQAPPWGGLCVPSSPVLTVLRRKVANRPLGALSCPGRSHNAGLTKRPKRLVSYIYNLPYPVNYLSWRTDFVLFYFFIKPTVTGEMAVSSTELSRIRARRGPLGPGPCQKPEQCAVSDARLVRGHRYGISPLLPLAGRPQSRTEEILVARLGSCTLPVDSKSD